MISQTPRSYISTVTLARADLGEMIKLVKLLYSLSKQPEYCQQLKPILPETAQFDPRHDSVLMGYDFHLDDTGPKLIEVNNNAGGLWLAWQAHYPNSTGFTGKLADRLSAMFRQEFTLWCGSENASLTNIAIMDADPETQFLYPELQAFAKLLEQHGINTFILDPRELILKESGLHYQNTRIDMLYNRHCDFYLDTPALTHVRKAWLAKQVCLSPNPHTYGLLADKRRMIDWSTRKHPAIRRLTAEQQLTLQRTIPDTRLLATENREQLWQQRKQWVFKPVTAYASRGVYLGKKITTGKFAELNPNETLVQYYIAPSIFEAQDGQQFKVDFRLFVYQAAVLSVAARIYQGQVTNLRTEGGGFACVKIV